MDVSTIEVRTLNQGSETLMNNVEYNESLGENKIASLMTKTSQMGNNFEAIDKAIRSNRSISLFTNPRSQTKE